MFFSKCSNLLVVMDVLKLSYGFSSTKMFIASRAAVVIQVSWLSSLMQFKIHLSYGTYKSL